MNTAKDKQRIIRDSADQSPCLCFNIRKASRAITQVYDDMFRELDLRSTQVFILARLDQISPLTILELAEAMATDRTTITRNLKPLERRGFIGIKCGKDKREREVDITFKGKQSLKKAFASFEKFQKQLHKEAGQQAVEQMCSDLNKIIKVVQKI